MVSRRTHIQKKIYICNGKRKFPLIVSALRLTLTAYKALTIILRSPEKPRKLQKVIE